MLVSNASVLVCTCGWLGSFLWEGLGEEPRSDWRRAVAAVSERRVAQGRALYTERSPAELYRGARSSERERYARPRGPRKFALANFWGELASRVGAERVDPSPSFVHVGIMSSPA